MGPERPPSVYPSGVIIVKSPLRLSLGGGGTDLPSYYEQFEGHLLSVTIDKYVYVSIGRPFSPGIKLNYSIQEFIESVSQVKHPIIRESLIELKLDTPQIEISSFADVPAGTGLGSSGSFTSGLLLALHQHYHRNISTSELADLACKIEIERLAQPIGKQDQYSAVYGGLNSYRFLKTGSVEVSPLKIEWEVRKKLERNLILFFTGYSRSANSVLAEQVAGTGTGTGKTSEMLQNLHKVKEMGFAAKEYLERGDLDSFGNQLDEHWKLKKNRSSQMSSSYIDDIYDFALKNSALGGKLVGAGGGGFLLFYTNTPDKLIESMSKKGLLPLHFKFDSFGTRVISS